MSIAIYHKRQKDKPTLTYIREVFRDPSTHKPTSHILESFGNVIDDPEAMKLVEKRLQYYQANSGISPSSIAQKIKDLDWDSIPEDPDEAHCIGFAPYLKLWDELGLGKYFKTAGNNSHLPFDLNDYVAFLCCQRIFQPISKVASWRLRNCSAFDFSDIKLKHIYETLDILQRRKESIVEMLNRRTTELVGRDLTVALYDVTTLYFESFDQGGLRYRGMSKEHRTQETQVVLGLLVDADGMPLDYELFPGNTAEIHTMLKVIKDYAKRYGLGQVTVVADAGLNQLLNLHRLQQEGYRYIVNWPPYSKLSEDKQEEFLEPTGWMKGKSEDGLEFGFKEMKTKITKTVRDSSNKTEKQPKGEPVKVDLELRIVGTYSEARKAHDIEVINEKWEKAKKLAAAGPKKYASSTKKGAGSYLKTEIKSVEASEEYHQKKLKWAGYTAVATNIPESEMGGPLIYKTLRQLWKIEYDFRLLKTNLSARPVFVWTDEHIKGHVLMCYISLVLLQLMGRLLKKAKVFLSEAEVAQALGTLYIAPVAALDKTERGLVHYLCIPKDSVDKLLQKEISKTRLAECKKIFMATGIKPLRSLETLRSIKTKLGVKFDLRDDLAG